MNNQKNLFSKYCSNTSAGTSHNAILIQEEPFRACYRAWLRPQAYGTFSWRFWFSNLVDSTFEEGTVAYHDRIGGNWKIVKALVRVAPAPGAEGGAEIPVTFDGNREKEVVPAEQFWSDTVEISLNEGEVLLWEWTLEGNGIPCTGDSQITTQTSTDEGITWGNQDLCPMPDLFGCDRPVKKRLVFLGDSITQGCCTPRDEYDHWVGRISRHIGPEYSVWNLGLGCARSSDLTDGKVWIQKALSSECDAVNLCYGVNDINWNPVEPQSADQLFGRLKQLVKTFRDAGKQVILYNIPAFDFDYSPERLAIWEDVNARLPELAETNGCTFYDMAAATDCPGHRGHGRYEPHPTGYGCYMIEGDIMEKIGDAYRA